MYRVLLDKMEIPFTNEMLTTCTPARSGDLGDVH